MTPDNHPGINKVALTQKAQGAFLGAAIGDALGWPQEGWASRVTQTSSRVPDPAFQRWTRRSGGRFYSHEETILPGEYSDDTQLLICTARSLVHGTQWWYHLTKRELPTWILYERGGGRATKHAVEAWLTGREPWASDGKTDRKPYFDAGGNGVAMRIMPHCLLGVAEAEFGKVAKNIVANGVCTHGHPRALVGALAYGYAVWLAFRETNTLHYGAIIEKTLSNVGVWSVLPDLGDVWPTWKRSADDMSARQFNESWRVTVAEMLHLLERCQEAMKQGALSVDQEVLTQLGCFARSERGAGTVAATASIFLASRYAADPVHGLIEAAFAHGADTDTIASMTGGILGAVAGIEWLGDHVEHIQDAQYLKVLGEHLASSGKTDRSGFENAPQITRRDLDSLFEKLEASKPADTILLPNGMEARVSAPQFHQVRSKTIQMVSWKLTTTEGQSLYIKKISRNNLCKFGWDHRLGIVRLQEKHRAATEAHNSKSEFHCFSRNPFVRSCLQ